MQSSDSEANRVEAIIEALPRCSFASPFLRASGTRVVTVTSVN